MLADAALEVCRIDPDRPALIEGIEAVTVVGEAKRADLDYVSRHQWSRPTNALAVDPRAVRRVAIAQHVAVVFPRKLRVASRHEWLVEPDVGAGAPDREQRGAGRRREVLDRRDPRRERIAIDEREHVRVGRIGKPHDIAVVQHRVGDLRAAE